MHIYSDLFASSAELVGEFWLREVAEIVIRAVSAIIRVSDFLEA